MLRTNKIKYCKFETVASLNIVNTYQGAITPTVPSFDLPPSGLPMKYNTFYTLPVAVSIKERLPSPPHFARRKVCCQLCFVQHVSLTGRMAAPSSPGGAAHNN